MYEIYVNLTCIIDCLSIPNTKAGPIENCFGQVSQYSLTLHYKTIIYKYWLKFITVYRPCGHKTFRVRVLYLYSKNLPIRILHVLDEAF